MGTTRESRAAVLFVDDEPSVLESFEASFRRMPYDIFFARSPHEALMLLGQQRVDVIVTDERMPGMSGSQMLVLLRQHYPNVVRIVLTGYASVEAAQRAVSEGGADRFLSKPIAAAELSREIENTLRLSERYGGWAPQSSHTDALRSELSRIEATRGTPSAERSHGEDAAEITGPVGARR